MNQHILTNQAWDFSPVVCKIFFDQAVSEGQDETVHWVIPMVRAMVCAAVGGADDGVKNPTWHNSVSFLHHSAHRHVGIGLSV